MLNKNFWAFASGTSVILLISVFFFWPMLGHDYSFVIPGLIDLDTAWKKHGVLNPHFSPMKCFGTPVWSAPISFSLSILHLLTILTNDLIGLGLFVVIVSVSSFWGAFRLATRIGTSHFIAIYLAAGWTLQGWMIMRASVGHIMYISVGWFPLIVYLLMNQKTYFRDGLATILAGILISQFVYLGAPYAPFFMVVSFLVLLPLVFIWKQQILFHWKNLIIKMVGAGIVSLVIALPKVLAVSELMSAFPRIHPMHKAGFAALPYSFLNLFSFFPHDYKSIVKWAYGNWETIQFIYPFLLLALILVLAIKKDKKTLVTFFLSLSFILFISFVFTSGVLSGTFQGLPFFKSMHVSARWNIVTSLPMFFLCSVLLARENLIPEKWLQPLLVLVYLVPYIHLNQNNLQINYAYRGGYLPETNRLEYCYEPIFGYDMELFPRGSVKGAPFATGDYFDPRCYLPSAGCRPGTPLDKNKTHLLETYQLR